MKVCLFLCSSAAAVWGIGSESMLTVLLSQENDLSARAYTDFCRIKKEGFG